MWDYIAQTRQTDLRREAAARRLAKVARVERRLTLTRTFRSLIANINTWLQPRSDTASRPLITSREMQPCADA
jgi:hypothetical protein